MSAEKKQAAAPTQKPLLGLEEMARQARLSPLQLKRMVQSGQVPGVKVEGAWQFNPELVQQALRRRSQGR